MAKQKQPETPAQNGNGHLNGNGHTDADMKPKSNAGQPTKLNKKRTRIICNALKDGCTIKNACEIAGVSLSCYMNWRERAEVKQEPQYIEFLEATKEAIAEAEQALVRCIKKQAPKDWRAAVAILERRHPETWLKREYIRSEVTGANGGPIQQKVEVTERPLDEKALEQFAREIIKERDGTL